jgi:prophage regulatory protein
MTGQAIYTTDVKLAERYGVSRGTIWRWASKGEFPKPLKLSPGCSRWKIEDVDEWESARKKVRTKP